MRHITTLEDRKFQNDLYGGFCNNCGGYILLPDSPVSSSNKHDTCNCGNKFIEMDYEMLYVARTLHSCGITLVDSCVGHFHGGFKYGYIRIDISKFTCEKGFGREEFIYKYGHPAIWYIDNVDMVVDDHFHISMKAYFNPSVNSESKFNEHKDTYMHSLYDWVDKVYESIHGTPNEVCDR